MTNLRPYQTVVVRDRNGNSIQMKVDNHPIFEIPGAREKIEKYADKYHPLSEDKKDLSFDFDYAVIREHMDTCGEEVKSVTDIGCAWGVQNLFFQDLLYIGIDMTKPGGEDPFSQEYLDIPFFREGEEKVQYYVTKFPHGLLEMMVGDVFISNMAVGYSSLSEAEYEWMHSALSQFQAGYIRTNDEVLEVVKEVFPNVELVRPECYQEGFKRKMYYVSK